MVNKGTEDAMQSGTSSRIPHPQLNGRAMRCEDGPFRDRLVPRSELHNPACDYSLLGEKQFLTVLNGIDCLLELEGLANRRRTLNAPSLPRWNEIQRGLIVQRKLELEKQKGKKK